MKTQELPKNLDAERAVLGGILHGGRGQLADVRDRLAATDFYSPGHGALYAAACDLDDKQQPVDALSVMDRIAALKTDHHVRILGGEGYVEEMSRLRPRGDQLRHFARIITRTAAQRRIIQFAKEAQARAYEDCDDLAQFAGRLTTDLSTAIGALGRKEARPARAIMHDAVTRYETRHHKKMSPGLTCGWPDIDVCLGGGLCDGHLILVGGRPGMGKSAWVMQVARACGAPVLVFSLEMTEADLADRTITQEGRLSYQDFRAGELENRKMPTMLRAVNDISNAPLWIDDESGQSYTQIAAKARRWRAAQSLENQARGLPDKALIVVDFFQLIRTGGRSENRAQDLGAMAANLKALAKELRCPIIAVVSLNRDCDKRGDKRPMISDIKESGIESDADSVLFVYRNFVYSGDAADVDVAEILIEKARHGTAKRLKLQFDGPSVRFGKIL